MIKKETLNVFFEKYKVGVASVFLETTLSLC